MTPRPGIGILEESTDVNVFRRFWSVVRKPRKFARAHSGRSAATGGHVGNRSLGGTEEIGGGPRGQGARGERVPDVAFLHHERHLGGFYQRFINDNAINSFLKVSLRRR